jgi:hypothetical protein
VLALLMESFFVGLVTAFGKNQNSSFAPPRCTASFCSSSNITHSPMAPTLSEVTRKTYPEQAKWFLNAFWKSGGQQAAEEVWNFCQKFIELDGDKRKNGNELDEFWSHKYVLGTLQVWFYFVLTARQGSWRPKDRLSPLWS